MAVIDAIPGLKVEVIADGARLQEHPDPAAPAGTIPNQATNYIEASPDGTFTVWTRFLHDFPEEYGFHVEIRVDGYRNSSRIVPLEGLKMPAGHVPLETRSQIRDSPYKSNMVFSPLAVGQYCLHSCEVSDLITLLMGQKIGTIVVLLHRIKNVHLARHPAHEKSSEAHYVHEMQTVPQIRSYFQTYVHPHILRLLCHD
jgi:hypothetical protein